MSAKSKIINNVRYITAKVAGKPVTVSETSIRSDLLFNDADGIDSLNNQAIFDAIQTMGSRSRTSEPGFELQGAKMVEMGHFEPTPTIPDSIPQGAGGNHGDQSSNDRSLSGSEDGLTLQSLHLLCISLCKQVTGQAIEIKALKAQIKKLKRRARPRRKTVKSSKGASSVPTNTEWDDLDMDIDDTMDYTLAQDMGKGGSSKGTARQQSTVKPDQGTDKENEGIDSIKVSTNKVEEGTDSIKLSTNKIEEGTAESDDNEPKESTTTIAQITTPTTPTATPTTFGDDEIIAQVLLNMSQAKAVSKEKGRTEEERKKLAEEEATKDALIQDFDDIQATIDADRILAERLQEDKR
ncbi:hypothetical protein Tco_0448157 [Tanacetum coccineum]